MARESIQEEAGGLCTQPLQKGRILAGRAGETGRSKREQPKQRPGGREDSVGDRHRGDQALWSQEGMLGSLGP